jgi:hypothetical protein
MPFPVRPAADRASLSTTPEAAGDSACPGWKAAADIQPKEDHIFPATLTRRLENAQSLGSLLDAAYDTFEDMLAVIHGQEDNDEDFFAGLIFAAAAAADGRDAILTAPSLPPAPPGNHPDAPPPSPAQTSGEIAAGVAALSGLLAARLTQAAESAESPADRAACRHAAHSARQIRDLLAGT